jgi:hypothetical protein
LHETEYPVYITDPTTMYLWETETTIGSLKKTA